MLLNSIKNQQVFPLRLFAVAFSISLLGNAFGAWQVWQLYHRHAQMYGKHTALTEDVGRVMLLDEVLTMSARMAAASGDFSYEKRYDLFEPQLTTAINKVRGALTDNEIALFSKDTNLANVALVKMERQAFALAHQGRRAEATLLLSGDEYMRLKKIYAGGMEKTVNAANGLIQRDVGLMRAQTHWLAVAGALSILALLSAWFFAARSARSWIAERRESWDLLRQTHDELESRVELRTADIGRANEELKREIYERSMVEANLLKTQSNLVTAQKLAAIGSWEWDVLNNVASWSDETYRIFGIDKNELREHRENFLDLVLAGDRGKVDQALSDALNGVRKYDVEYRVSLACGTHKVIHAMGEIVRDAKGVPTMMTGTVQDITVRKQTEDELRHYKDHLEEVVQMRTSELVLARNEAEAANKAKSVFLSSMSHELRTPLNAILGFSSLMSRSPLLQRDQRECLDIINRSGEHLLVLINDVLEMSRIEAGRVQLENAPFDLGALVRDVTEMMQVRANEKGLQLLVDQSSEFPRYVRGDEARVRQVLINLVGNAVKFTGHGGVTVRLGTRENASTHLLIEVEDTGIGISVANQKTIFDPFVQLEKMATQAGSGLGLAITRQFVQLMGGVISVESTPGKGSTFRVELPLEKVEACDMARPMASEIGEITGLAAGQPECRILIVEDQLENQLLLTKLMKRIGLAVKVAKNGEQGVSLFQSWQPDLIWMDRRMPVMDGLEATRRIRELPGGTDVKIVAVTASVFKEQRDEILAAGMDEFVRKPYRFNEIYEALGRQLGLQYTYADTFAAREMPVLTADSLAVLPQQLRGELHAALEILDGERISAAINQVADPGLRKSLMHLAENYDYPAILKLLPATGSLP